MQNEKICYFVFKIYFAKNNLVKKLPFSARQILIKASIKVFAFVLVNVKKQRKEIVKTFNLFFRIVIRKNFCIKYFYFDCLTITTFF